MARVIVLDSTPLWLAAMPSGKPRADECRQWLDALLQAGFLVSIPEIADYEVRRELFLRGAIAGLKRLDDIKGRLDFRPITSAAMVRAAELWALLRRAGIPTAGRSDIDADAILAGSTLTTWDPADDVLIATRNVDHFSRFPGITAKLWETIT